MRAIIYPHKLRALEDHATGAHATQSPTYGTRGEGRAAVEAATDDDYLGRLAKHVPAEVLAVFLLLGALLADEPLGWRVAAVAFSAAAAIALDRQARNRVDPRLRVVGLVYDVFIVAAFLGWALGTSVMARDLVGLNQAQASFITIVIAFGLAFADDPLGERFGKQAVPAAGPRQRREAGKRRRAPRPPKTDRNER